MFDGTTKKLKDLRVELMAVKLQRRMIKDPEELTKINALYDELTKSYKHLAFMQVQEKEGRKL